MELICFSTTYILLLYRYWSYNHLSNPRAVPSNIRCSDRTADLSPPLAWDHYGRSQPEGGGRETTEGGEPSRCYSRKTPGSFTGVRMHAQDWCDDPLPNTWSFFCRTQKVFYTRIFSVLLLMKLTEYWRLDLRKK